MTEIKDLQVTTDHPNWCPGCVVPDTLIQTNPSVRLVTDLKKEDKVISSDGHAHEITETMQHIHDGEVIRLVTKYWGETTLTPEHPVLAVRRIHKHPNNKEYSSDWIESQELRVGDYLQYPVMREIRDQDSLAIVYTKKHKDTRSRDLPEEVILSPQFIRLCGYYLAEGYVHRRAVHFTFHEKEIDYADDINSAMKEAFDLESESSFRRDKHTLDLSFNSSYLAEMFVEWFDHGAEHKKIPSYLMFLPPTKQRELIRGMWRGDGWVHKTTHRASYKTISKILSEQVKMLLLRQRILPTIAVNKAYGIHKVSYGIQVIDSHDFILLQQILSGKTDRQPELRKRNFITSENVFLPLKKVEKLQYTGPVYNFEVETENAYVTENATLHNCGDFGIWVSLKKAIVELGLNPWEVVLISGIGCSSKLPYWVKTYGFNGLHGRPVPVAEGIKLANDGLTVIVIGGDGDQFAEGGNHWIHAARRNVNITVLVHDNQIYGLTTGQYSATTEMGEKNKATPVPTVEAPLNVMSMALSAGATFVARGYAGDTKLETQMLVEAIRHKGFSIVDSMQPCVTFNHHNTYTWFNEHIYSLESEGHDPTDRMVAFKRAEEWPKKHLIAEGESERVGVGIFYKETRPTWEDGIPQIKDVPLVKQPVESIDIQPLFDELM